MMAPAPVMCPDCLVLMIHQGDGTWICPYALAVKAWTTNQQQEADR